MDRSDFYFEQLVTEGEMDQAFDDVERMERDKILEFDLWGVHNGLVVSQHGAGDLTVDISAGAAHNDLGERIEVPSLLNPDLSSYEPSTPGESVWIRLCLKQDRALSDPRIDGDLDPVDYRQTESYELVIVVGTPAVGPSKPSVPANHVLLADIELVNGQTQILDADIDAEWTLGERMLCEIIRGGKLNTQDIHFNSSLDLIIKNLAQVILSSGTGAGLTTSGRNVVLGGGDIVGADDVAADHVTLSVGTGTGVDYQGKDAANINQLSFDSGADGLTSEDAAIPIQKDIDLDANDALKATALQAADPHASAGNGHVYANTSTGALVEVTKKIPIPCSAFAPSNDQYQVTPWADPTSPTDNSWLKDDDNSLGTPPVYWRDYFEYNMNLPGAGYSNGLQIPLILPNGASLESVEIDLVSTGMPAGTPQVDIALNIQKRRYATQSLIHSTLTWSNYGSGNHTHSQTVGAGNKIIDPDYMYSAVVILRTDGAYNGDCGVRVSGARMVVKIKEASWVY